MLTRIDPYPYADYLSTLRTPETRELLHTMEQESIVLLENKNSVLPLSKSISSLALIGPQVDRVSFGDYVFFNASLNGISPLEGFTQLLANTSVSLTYAQGCELWSNDPSGIPAAVAAAKSADATVVMVGTWTLDQTLLWTPGTNATTGEHVDLSDLGLVGAQMQLVQAVTDAAKGPVIVVLVSGKPVAEPWIQESVCPAFGLHAVMLTSPLRRRCGRPTVLPGRAWWTCARRDHLRGREPLG